MGAELPVKITVGLVDEISQKLDKLKDKFPALQKQVSRVKNNFDFVQESTAGFRKSVEGLSKSVGEPMKKVGSAMSKYITLPVVAGAAYSIKKFMDFENALTEVQGATNLSGQELTTFGERMVKLSSQTTFSQDELLGFAATAGEAGVRGASNLEQFSLVLAKLGKTANIVGPEAALALKKILDLTGEGEGKISNFGSALTALENNYNVNAKRVLESTQSITREVAKFGLSSSQVLGFAAAIEPLGFEAKQAAMAVGEGFRGIDTAIREGGIKMVGLQKITGMTGDQLKETFKKDPQAVFNAFLGGLKKIDDAGGQTGKALEFFGASGDKTQIILSSLAKNTDKLTEVQKAARTEFELNTALNNEYNETTGTLTATLKHLKNNTDALSTSLGNRLAPFIKIAADALGGLVGWFNEHPKIATFVAVIAGFLAIMGPIIFAIGSFLTIIPGLLIGMNLITAAFGFLGGVAWAAMIPIILVIAKFLLIAAAIGLVVWAVWHFRDAIVKGLITAWDWVIKKIQQAIELMKEVTAFMSQGILKYTPLGALAFGANKALNAIQPNGPEQNLNASAKSANSEFQTQTNNAHVTVDVRAPMSTGVRSESSNGAMTLNRGLVGAF
jgi:TP901 family phage tail tape measure protein